MLRLLEEQETRVRAPQDALIAGEGFGEMRPFDTQAFLARMHAKPAAQRGDENLLAVATGRSRSGRSLALHSGNWSLGQADSYNHDLVAAFGALPSGAWRRIMVEVRWGYRKHPFGSHMIYFRDNGDRVEIVRILYNKQDPERH